MNLQELLRKAELAKVELHKQLDKINSDIKNIEDVLSDLPNVEFFTQVNKTNFLDQVVPVGKIYMNEGRMYLLYENAASDFSFLRKPLCEFPMNVRLECDKFLNTFLEGYLKELGVL